MYKFNIGDRIIKIENGAIRRGVVLGVYDELITPIFKVEFEDGSIEKVDPRDMTLEPKTEPQDERPKEPIEKSEITITPKEFRDIGIALITETAIKANDIFLGMKLTVFLAQLHKALFIDEH